MAAIVAATFALALSSQAAAQPNKANKASEADKHTARQMVATGDEYFTKGDYEAALKSYHGAHVIMGVPTTGWEVARTQVALGQLLEARKTLREVMDYRQNTRTPAFEKAQERAKDLLVDLELRIPTLQITVVGAPAGAAVAVAVDGAGLSDSQLGKAQQLNPGSHHVIASTPGLQEVTRTLLLKPGDRTKVELVLGTSSGRWPYIYSGFAVTGVGLIVGTITGAISLVRAGEVKDICTPPVCSRQDEDRIEPIRRESVALAHTSTAFFALAGAGAVLATVPLVIELTSRSDGGDVASETASIAPVIGPGYLGLQGRF